MSQTSIYEATHSLVLEVLGQNNLAELGSIADNESGTRSRKSNQSLIFDIEKHAKAQVQR